LKKIAILGSTGSIGRQTLEVVAAHPDRFQVVALAAGENLRLLAEQIGKFRPQMAALKDSTKRDKLRDMVPGGWASTGSLELLGGRQGLIEIVRHPEVDLVVVATAGAAGLEPTIAALREGKNVALANKEALVMAGEHVIAAARDHGASILPIDSEHSAIWQCLRGDGDDRGGEGGNSVARLILTASGGAFRDASPAELEHVTAADALRHPNWLMGKKVTIDSATLMNKGLEVIEAHWLFDAPFANIAIVIHRESIVHSMVEFVDGSVKAQLGPPDMRLPIQYALSYPDRLATSAFPKLDLTKLGRLTFEEPEMGRFPCLKLALQAGERGGTYPAVLSAADDVAVGLFLAGRIGFTEIAGLVARVLDRHQVVTHPSIEDILAADRWARGELLSSEVF
jgi:1-deoxy-D-xylulose-5-phosphate reductoisomerase